MGHTRLSSGYSVLQSRWSGSHFLCIIPQNSLLLINGWNYPLFKIVINCLGSSKHHRMTASVSIKGSHSYWNWVHLVVWWHRSCTRQLGPTIPSVYKCGTPEIKGYMDSSFAVFWQQSCKTWTVDFGLDYGLDWNNYYILDLVLNWALSHWHV